MSGEGVEMDLNATADQPEKDVEAEKIEDDDEKDVEAQKIVEDDEVAADSKSLSEKLLSDVSLVTKAVLAFIAVMIVLWLIAMINPLSTGDSVVKVSACIAIALGLVVAKYQYFDIESTDSLRTVQNELRGHVNRFTIQNDRLHGNNDRLEAELLPLKESEEKLGKLAEESGSDINELKELIKENGEIIKEKKKVIRDDIIESLVNAVFQGERSEDGEFSDREINMLCNKMRAFETADLVTINEELLRAAIERNRSVLALIDLIRDLDKDGDQQGDKIFMINDDAYLKDMESNA